MLMRPVQQNDIDALHHLAKNSGIGVTSLPDNLKKMQAKLAQSLASFAQTNAPAERLYLFALEDETNGQLVGICALEASIGHDDVWYNYHVSKSVHASKDLGVHKVTQTLYLVNDLTGCSEIATLFLMPDYRKNQNGQLLSRSRYLFLAEHPQLFGDEIIAEMRGVSDEQGRSPFWESLGQHFFKMTFSDADYLTGLGDKMFIAELMPKFPIYSPMLSHEAQRVIGQVHPQTEPALAMLKSEGFDFNGYVDIFDAGPTVEADISNIKTIRDCQNRTVVIGDMAQGSETSFMLSNHKLVDFRALLSTMTLDANSETVTLSAELANALHVSEGDVITIAPL